MASGLLNLFLSWAVVSLEEVLYKDVIFYLFGMHFLEKIKNLS